ncbi:heavy-metal-associated domain-containing protein [Lacihabitans sp. LS3-19]|uniref:heavy-metal-associated domain-containing protein n=1 Tax=Lacihabitans sp. LS3-19 TaxID=2487335 RepID=UPI0020CF30BF|nr:heavy metal-associated domain-containing protein [Lacihabitans sp. LS3-19]MCP9768499.1 heavy-metal-associated domain-containing protein [Lacihabitans sp. LS3-19]
MKKIVALLVTILALNFSVNAQANKTEEVKFKTSAKCSMCKARIEGDMGKSAGVKSVKLNLDDKTVSIVYNPKKVNKDELKTRISKIGYDADEVVANQKSHDALPSCCQKDAKAHMD